jgi:hypothetical protein
MLARATLAPTRRSSSPSQIDGLASEEFAAFLDQAVGGEYTCLVAREGDEIEGALPFFTRRDRFTEASSTAFRGTGATGDARSKR